MRVVQPDHSIIQLRGVVRTSHASAQLCRHVMTQYLHVLIAILSVIAKHVHIPTLVVPARGI